jgi:S-adenosylmethionine:tRNA ribosyltransferase-isomerase
MRLVDLSYELSPSHLACEPREIRLGDRDRGRMLVVRRDTGDVLHSTVLDLAEQLTPGDVLVLNNSKSSPGVLKTRTIPVGAQIELRIAFFDGERRAITRAWPTHFVKEGLTVRTLSGEKLTITEVNIPPHGLCAVEGAIPLLETLKKEGLPITSFFYKGYWKPEHYHPVYASAEGSVESPLAGLHFTWHLLDLLKARGVVVEFVTLHVAGSWLPFLEEESSDHEAPPEEFFVPPETAAAIDRAGIVTATSRKRRRPTQGPSFRPERPRPATVSRLRLERSAEWIGR